MKPKAQKPKPVFAYILNYTPSVANGEGSIVKKYGDNAVDAAIRLQKEVDALLAVGHVFTAEDGMSMDIDEHSSWLFSYKHQEEGNHYFFCHGKISQEALAIATQPATA